MHLFLISTEVLAQRDFVNALGLIKVFSYSGGSVLLDVASRDVLSNCVLRFLTEQQNELLVLLVLLLDTAKTVELVDQLPIR